jgi:hypothetical protein
VILDERIRAAPPLSDISAAQREELDALLAEADAVEDLPGKWQAAVIEAELRAGGEEPAHGDGHRCH